MSGKSRRAAKRKKRTFTKKIGARPFSGTRFVEAKKLRIEWWPGGKRKAKTIGPNTKENRDYADGVLETALTRARAACDGADPAAKDISIGDLLSRYLEDAKTRRTRSGKPLRPRTLKLYAQHTAHLRSHFADRLAQPARTLRRPEVRAFMTARRKTDWEDKSIALVVDYLKGAYSWALAEVELIDANPIAGVKSPSRKGHAQSYTADECLRLFDGLRNLPARSWRFRTLAMLEAVYGARAGQLINLQWTDVDLHAACSLQLPGREPLALKGKITLREEVEGSKGQPTRDLAMLPFVRSALLEAWSRRHPDSLYVLWGWHNHSKPVRYDSMNHSLEDHERRVGVEHIKGRAFHAFRRAVATGLAEALGAKTAADWIGNTLGATLAHYVKESKTTVAAAAHWLLSIFGEGGNSAEPRPNRASAGTAEKDEAASA